MRINKITLNNFGSYEGLNIFDINPDPSKTIVLVGGKNGAGKTTLFTAIRVCLYGYMSMGYKNYNSYYTKAVTKLINNKVKLVKPAKASVELELSIIEGRDQNTYLLERKWELTSSLSEVFTVKKNGIYLNSEEIADFEKYLMNLIPPELFNLYFFDGEKIADFFLEEGGNNRIREAFLTLCGYDTFSIMEKNFKRVHQQSSTKNSNSDGYFSAQTKYQELFSKVSELKSRLNACLDEQDQNSADLKQLEDAYSKSGGITNEEWKKLLEDMKAEEKAREELNTWIKRMANDVIPFLMVRDKLIEIKEQIAAEESNQKLVDFDEILSSTIVMDLVKTPTEKKLIERIHNAVLTSQDGTNQNILALSVDDKANVIATINNILNFDESAIIDAKKKLKRSINRTAKLRKELEQSNIDSVNKYMEQKSRLLESKNSLLNMQIEIEAALHTEESNLMQQEAIYNSERTKFEESLKKESIADISGKAILMLEALQASLYHKQIEKVQKEFLIEIKTLIRKDNFIDDIKIDDDFNLHIYRNETITVEDLKKAIIDNKEFVDSATYKALFPLFNVTKNGDVIRILWNTDDTSYRLPVEIDKTRLSNGEKQIFIMALYHSLIKLCTHEIPFIIDTPFARIDSEHRNNISKYFFSKLHGQVFILSTNEEIKTDHVSIMKDRIASTFMLENTDNSRTRVIADNYFGE